VDRHGNALSNATVKALHRTDWQGRQLLYPTARTNLVAYNNIWNGALEPDWRQYISTSFSFIDDPAGGNAAIRCSDASAGANNFGVYKVRTTPLSGTNTLKVALRSSSAADQIVYFGADDATASMTTITGSWAIYEVTISGGYSTVYPRIFQVYTPQGSVPFDIYLPMTVAGSPVGTLYEQAAVAPFTDYTDNGDGTVGLGQAAESGDAYDFSGVQRR